MSPTLRKKLDLTGAVDVLWDDRKRIKSLEFENKQLAARLEALEKDLVSSLYREKK